MRLGSRKKSVRWQDERRQRGAANVARRHQPMVKGCGGDTDVRQFALTVLTVSACTFLALNLVVSVLQIQEDVPDLSDYIAAPTEAQALGSRALLFFNRPPNTGSRTVYMAIEKAVKAEGLSSASCFEGTRRNEMAMRTIFSRNNVDFYGCSVRMQRDRFREVARMRNGNVTFVTNTREPKEVILSSFLKANRAQNFLSISDPERIKGEVNAFRNYVAKYPVDALYSFHGAAVPLKSCPTKYAHLEAMRLAVSRYEIVIDLRHTREAAELMAIVTGLRPDFSSSNAGDSEMDFSKPMLAALSKVDVSKVSCGNELVHRVLQQQFNIIKDRLMQNRCFDEASGTFELCKIAVLKKSEIAERTRKESYQARKKLLKLAGF